ncbi:MAG: site-specific integrase, partial [Bacteroidetes bacterium]|nr:site-specific integrase [Bacteroidota bacterium]
MIKYNAENERIKRKYFIYLKEAFKKSQSTIDNIR